LSFLLSFDRGFNVFSLKHNKKDNLEKHTFENNIPRPKARDLILKEFTLAGAIDKIIARARVNNTII
jgi:hypothetical protein